MRLLIVALTHRTFCVKFLSLSLCLITYLDVSIVAPFSCNPSLVFAASTKPGLMAKRSKKIKFDRYPHNNLVPYP